MKVGQLMDLGTGRLEQSRSPNASQPNARALFARSAPVKTRKSANKKTMYFGVRASGRQQRTAPAVDQPGDPHRRGQGAPKKKIRKCPHLRQGRPRKWRQRRHAGRPRAVPHLFTVKGKPSKACTWKMPASCSSTEPYFFEIFFRFRFSFFRNRRRWGKTALSHRNR